MSMLFGGDGDGSGRTGSAEPAWRRVARRPLVVLVLGLLSTAVVMLTLFGPFYRDDIGPGHLLAWRLADGPARFLPDELQWRLYEHPFALLLILSVIVLVLVPSWIAFARRRADQRSQAGPRPGSISRSGSASHSSTTSRSGTTSHAGFSISTRVTHERRETSVEFTEEGSIERSGAAAGAVCYSVADLRSMAHVAGIPWKSAYETDGGARAFLEILRSVMAGASPVPAAEDTATTGTGTEPGPGTVAGAGAGTEWATGATSSSESLAAGAGGFTSSASPAPYSSSPTSSTSTTSSTSWNSDFTSSGSVYTPTSLYDAERAERTVLGTDHGEDDSTEASR